MNKLYCGLYCAGLLFSSSTALAAEAAADPSLRHEVLVTARGYAASQSETPGSVGVVTERDITLAPKGSLVDSLQSLPGVTRTGDSPWGQDISIRGLSGPSVVILLDGKRINTATDMNARLGFINPSDVERIEVLKGPVSALYGSGSTGGVVNIITRKAKFTRETAPRGRFAASGGTNPGGVDVYGNGSLSGPDAWAFVSGARRRYGDTYGGHASRVYDSGFMDSQGRAMIGIKPWEPLALTFEALRSAGYDIGIPGGVNSMPALARVRYPRTRFTFLSLDAALDVNGAYLKTLEGSVYYTANERRVLVDKIPPAASGAYAVELKPSADHQTWGGQLQGTVEAGSHTVVAGVDFWTWSVSSDRTRSIWRPAKAGGPITFSDSPVPDPTQISTGLYIEDNWKLHEDWTVNLGARLDYLRTRADAMYLVSPAPGPNSTTRKKLYGETGENDVGRHVHAGLTWKMNQAWSQSGLLASSYRAADMMERFKYINLGGGLELYGNPKLDPEQSLYAEYGLHYDQKPFRADLRLFVNTVTNYIAEKNVSAQRIELDNVSEARIYGVEFDSRWQFLDKWGLYGNVTALHGRDERKKQALPGVAPVSGKIGVDFTHPLGFWAKIEGVGIAPQPYRPDGVKAANGVITMNAAAGCRFQTAGLKHDISLSLNNIFDVRYSNYLAQQRGYRVWEPGFAAMLNYSVEF